jgi:hypothetical protein
MIKWPDRTRHVDVPVGKLVTATFVFIDFQHCVAL